MAQFPNTTNADGIWTLKKVRRAILGDNWPEVSVGDQFFANTVLLLQADDVTDGSQNNTFLDSSTNAHTITRNGNATQGSFSPFSQDEGKWGVHFDGSSDYLESDNNAAWQFGTGDYTLEAWIYLDELPASGSSYIIASYYASTTTVWYWRVNNNSGQMRIGVYDSMFNYDFEAGKWYHVVCARGSSQLKTWVNGEYLGSLSNTTNIVDHSVKLRIGVFQSTFSNNFDSYFNGYISNLRITKGTARYTGTSNITVPTAPYTDESSDLLTCQSNRFIDNSSNDRGVDAGGTPEVAPFSPFAPSTAYDPVTKGGSGYFDGNSSYLRCASDSSFAFGTGDFTIEGWIYWQGGSLGPTLYDAGNSNSSGSLWLGVYGGTLYFRINGTSNDITVSNATAGIKQNTWFHLAATRESGTVRVYVDGNQVMTGTRTQSITQQEPWVGYNPNGGSTFYIGYMCDWRAVKGTAVYTGASGFTPPTAPLTAITNTSGLLNFTNAGIYDGTGRNVLETVGNAQVDTTVKKYGAGSMQFDGTGDYLFSPSSPQYELSGDFTIEMWLYRAVSGNNHFFSVGDVNTSTGIEAYIGSSGTALNVYSGGATRITSSTLPAVTTWAHLAVVRSSGTVSLYLDGTSLGTWSSSTTFSGDVRIGAEFYNGSVTATMNGYIDDLRITKGVARYTANFTPPAAGLPIVGE